MKIGIIGTGIIVERMIESMKDVDDVSLEALYSRTLETAEDFCKKFAITEAFDSIDVMLSESDIDAVYIASPNSLHYEHARKCLESGKHVFVEKPLFGNVERAKEIFALAQSKHCFIFETIYNIYLPNFKILQSKLKEIGPLNLVECNFSKKSSRYDDLLNGKLPNVFNPTFSGGALADLNIYNIHALVKLLGIPNSSYYDAILHENGIDLTGVATLRYENCLAVAIASKQSGDSNYAKFQGLNGYINVMGGLNRIESIEVNVGGNVGSFDVQDKSHMSYQFNEFISLINASDYDALNESMAHSLNVINLACELRKQVGLDFEY